MNASGLDKIGNLGKQEYLEKSRRTIETLKESQVRQLLAVGDVLSRFLPELPSFRQYQESEGGGADPFGYLEKHLRRHLNLLTALEWLDRHACTPCRIPHLTRRNVKGLISPLAEPAAGEAGRDEPFEEALKIKEAIRTAIHGPGALDELTDDVIVHAYESTREGERARRAVHLLDRLCVPGPGGKSWSEAFGESPPCVRSHLITRFERALASDD